MVVNALYTCPTPGCQSHKFIKQADGTLKCFFCGSIFTEDQLRQSDEEFQSFSKEIKAEVQHIFECERLEDRLAGFEKLAGELQQQLALNSAELEKAISAGTETTILTQDRDAILKQLNDAKDLINDLEAQKSYLEESLKGEKTKKITIVDALSRADEKDISSFMYPAIGIRNLIERNLIENSSLYGFRYGNATITDGHGKQDYHKHDFYLPTSTGNYSLNKKKRFTMAFRYLRPDLQFSDYPPYNRDGDPLVLNATNYMDDIHALAHNTDNSQLDDVRTNATQRGMSLREYLFSLWKWFYQHKLAGATEPHE